MPAQTRLSLGSSPRAGTILEGTGQVGYALGCQPRRSGIVTRRPRQNGLLVKGITAGLHPAIRGSSPRRSTNSVAVSQWQAHRFSAGQRGFESLQRHQAVARSTLGVARAHNPLSDRVRIPCALPVPGSSNGRASVLQTDDGGSNPSPGTNFDGGRRQTVRREAVNLVLAGSTPVAHPNVFGS